jgi:hypothetical protein
MDRIDTPKAVALLSQPKWLALSQSTRARLVQLFGLKRSSSTETFTGRDSITRVVSDGYTAEDLLAVTTEKMQKILDTDRTDFYEMFDEIVANIEAPAKVSPDPGGDNIAKELFDDDFTASGIPEATKEILKRRAGRPRRNV